MSTILQPDHQHVSGGSCERRLFPRLPIPVQVELRVAGGDFPIRAVTADLSPGGCYIEMAVTLPVGTNLGIVLWLGHEKMMLDGRVVTRHAQFGNGIEFTAMCEESIEELQRFLEVARRESQQKPF